ncbi:MAG: hypothetical protein ACPL7I_06565, partial [Myxococcota bacterium]
FTDPVHPYTRELIEASTFKVDETILNSDNYSKVDVDAKFNCPFTRCREIDRCNKTLLVERKISETHSVFCNL